MKVNLEAPKRIQSPTILSTSPAQQVLSGESKRWLQVPDTSLRRWAEGEASLTTTGMGCSIFILFAIRKRRKLIDKADSRTSFIAIMVMERSLTGQKMQASIIAC